MSQATDYAIGLVVSLGDRLDPAVAERILHGGLRGISRTELNAIVDMLEDVKRGNAVRRISADQPEYHRRPPLRLAE